MDWFRHYHGLCTDPKLHKVARSAGVSRGLVIAAWCALLESASSSNERGRIDDMDGVSLGFLIDVKPHIATRILTAIQAAKMVDEDGRIAAWDRRQRGSDDAAGRKRIQRDRERETNPLKTPQSDSSCHATNPSRVEKNRVDKKENPLPPSEPQPSLLPPAEPPPLKYAWEGTVIRLKADAFEKWQRMCPDLDLRLELQVRDDWLTSPDATKDHRDRWFITTSNYLGGRQRKAAAEKAERLRTTGKTTSRHEEANRRRLAEQHATDAGLCPHSPEWMQFASQAMKGGLVNGQQHRAA